MISIGLAAGKLRLLKELTNIIGAIAQEAPMFEQTQQYYA